MKSTQLKPELRHFLTKQQCSYKLILIPTFITKTAIYSQNDMFIQSMKLPPLVYS